MADVRCELIEAERVQPGSIQAGRSTSIAAFIISAFDLEDTQYVG
jgi:hypothetical protein